MVGYTKEDEIIIQDRFEDLLASCAKIIKDDEDLGRIRKAFFLAKEAHKGVRRRSGEAYILHPIAVAKIVVEEVGLGVKSVVASLLHDVVEDTAYTVEEIETIFGEKIAYMVDGLTKMAGVFNTDVSKQAAYFRKVLLTLSDDVRVILIKIADRLHNMRTMESMPRDKQVKISSETLYLFAPLAYRLGLYTIKTELEDLSLKYRFPEQYRAIAAKLSETEEGRAAVIERICAPIRKRLEENNIDFTISGRVKSVYSIWSKMQRKQIPFEDVYDLFAVRIIFKPTGSIPEKSQCWYIYSLITDIYNPKPDRIRDWVNFPKANGYEALHATVMGPDGEWVEVQIRSERMEEIAERGFASHWKYKQAHSSEDEFDKWLRDVREALNGPTDDAVNFLDNIKLTLYTSEIVAFTPKGEPKKLPQGATVLDFAYEIHSNVGNTAIGAKVNHKIESIYEPVNNGDQIEIITSDNSHPVTEWLDHVTTAKAKQTIMSYLKKANQNNMERGMQIFDNRMREFGIKPSARLFRKLLPAYDCSNKDEFYIKLGMGIINLDNVDAVLRQNSKNKVLKFWNIQLGKQPRGSEAEEALSAGSSKKKGSAEEVPTPGRKKQKGGKGVEDALMRDGKKGGGKAPTFVLAESCNPIPGDEIIGYLDPETNTITVHKAGCEEITRLAAQHGENIVTDLKWSSYKSDSYLAEIEIRGIDRVGILMDVAQVITGELDINIRGMSVQSHDGIFEGKISVYVKDTENVQNILEKVGNVKGIERVKRVT